MGLDDEDEKLRQAEEWLMNGTPDQQAAACEYIDATCPYGCMPMDHRPEDPLC